MSTSKAEKKGLSTKLASYKTIDTTYFYLNRAVILWWILEFNDWSQIHYKLADSTPYLQGLRVGSLQMH